MHPSYNPATSNIRNFEYPSNIIKYMKQNAAPQQLLNLMQCSERFVIPYLPVQNLTINEGNKWRMRKLDNSLIQGTNCDEIPNNLWITKTIHLWAVPNLLPQILPKIDVIELKKLSFFRQAISCDDLVKLLSHGNVIIIKLWSSPVKYGDGDLVPLDEMLEICSNIRCIS